MTGATPVDRLPSGLALLCREISFLLELARRDQENSAQRIHETSEGLPRSMPLEHGQPLEHRSAQRAAEFELHAPAIPPLIAEIARIFSRMVRRVRRGVKACGPQRGQDAFAQLDVKPSDEGDRFRSLAPMQGHDHACPAGRIDEGRIVEAMAWKVKA